MILITKKYIKKITKYNNTHSIFIICIFFFSFSLIFFYSLEPGIDQIRHISWAKAMKELHKAGKEDVTPQHVSKHLGYNSN